MRIFVPAIVAVAFHFTGACVAEDPETDRIGNRQYTVTVDNLCGNKCCDVRKFGAVADDGLDDQPAIQAAITAALQTGHRHVYIPNGVWDVASGIDMTSGQSSRVTISGQHSIHTRLRWMDTLHYHIFNTHGNYPYFKVNLRNMSIDGSHLPYTSGTGHGVRAGGGWDTGYLHLDNLNIIHPGFYGVGMQVVKSDKPIKNMWLRNSYIGDTGSDGIDFKIPDVGNNTNISIHNVVFSGIGKSPLGLSHPNGDGSDAAIDLSADGFSLYRVSIVTPGEQHFESGTNYVTGIRLRRRAATSWNGAATKNGTINRTYVKYANHGIFFEGFNHSIEVKNSALKNLVQDGIYVRGQANSIASSTCIKAACRDTDRSNCAPVLVSAAHGGASSSNNALQPSTHCQSSSQFGATYTNRTSKSHISVDESMDCQ